MPTSAAGFAICVANQGAEDLEVRKVYRVLQDKAAATTGYMRVIDESGEDYLDLGTPSCPSNCPGGEARVDCGTAAVAWLLGRPVSACYERFVKLAGCCRSRRAVRSSSSSGMTPRHIGDILRA